MPANRARSSRNNSRPKPTSKKVPTALLPKWQKNFIIGIDDCICTRKNSRNVARSNDILDAVEVEGAKDWVNGLFAEGHYVCFLTTRAEEMRSATEAWLKEHGINYHELIMGKPEALEYHYIDDRHVQATTFRGKFTPLIKRDLNIEVFG